VNSYSLEIASDGPHFVELQVVLSHKIYATCYVPKLIALLKVDLVDFPIENFAVLKATVSGY